MKPMNFTPWNAPFLFTNTIMRRVRHPIQLKIPRVAWCYTGMKQAVIHVYWQSTTMICALSMKKIALGVVAKQSTPMAVVVV